MGLHIDWLAIDCADPGALARFWTEVLDYKVVNEKADEILLAPRDGSSQRLLLLKVPDKKAVKNRLHLDLRPDDQDAEVARLEQLGANRINVGQGSVSWVVMADPEGNEFCVLRALSDEERLRWDELWASGKY